MTEPDLFTTEPYGGHAPYVRGSETSIAAARDITPKMNALQERVYRFLVFMGSHGATDEEMQESLRMNPSTQRPRRVELVEKKLVVDSGMKRPTKGNHPATVWRAK